MKQLTRKEVKQYLLNILVNFDQFCKQNDLTMYLCAGTLLGAVRHHGFIPWDDDIDVCMDRESYNRLVSIAKKDPVFDKYYKVIDFQFGDSNYPYIKIIDLRTKMSQQFGNDVADYLWIDVFPMDGLPDDEKQQKRLYKKISTIREILMLSFAKPGQGRSFAKKVLKTPLIPLAKLYGLKRANNQLSKLSQSYDYYKTGMIGDVLWGDYGKEMLTVEEYFKSTKVTFEDYTFDTFACWDRYLTELYGNDYMEIPPKSKQVNHNLQAWLR